MKSQPDYTIAASLKGTPSLPYGDTVAQCARCRTRLSVRVETDGDGGLVDFVEPCPTCAPGQPRFVIRPAPKPALKQPRVLSMDPKAISARQRQSERRRASRAGRPPAPLEGVCKGCAEKFYQERRPGRPNSYCGTCRESAA